MTILDPNDNHAILINTFQVLPENADKLVDILHHASATMRELDGFVSANLHVSTDKKRVVNYVQWRTHANFEAMHKNPAAQPHMKAAAELAESYDPVFYTLRYADGGSDL